MRIIRSEKLKIHCAGRDDRDALDATLQLYRHYVRDLMVLINARWDRLAACQGTGQIQRSVEALIHPTAKRPAVSTRYFHRRYYKFPSYLRRVAIMDAFGQVRSFQTRFNRWLDGDRRSDTCKPPRLACATNTFPSLYHGQCLKFAGDDRSVQIKVYSGGDWVWRRYTLSGDQRFIARGRRRSSLLVQDRGRFLLSVPVEIEVPLRAKEDQTGRVLSVDVGINTAATTAVVDASGTVLDRKFFHRSDKDQEHRLMAAIRAAAKVATRHGNPLYAGFCATRYRKLKNLMRNAAHQISRRIIDTATSWDCDAVIVEHLKGWRPKGGKKRSALKARFHRWFHRLLVRLIQSKAQEAGLRFRTVYARGTSHYAYDGSGKVQRDKSNYALATFSNGKRYNADLNAAYNIAARGILLLYHGGSGDRASGVVGQKSRGTQRSPVTLSSLWAMAHAG